MKRTDQLELLRRKIDGELAGDDAAELARLCADPARRAELDALESLARDLPALRAPVPLEDDFVSAVMRALPDRVPQRRSFAAWLLRPMSLKFTPALAFAALGILLGAGVLVARLAMGPSRHPAVATAPAPLPAPVAPLAAAPAQPAQPLIDVRFMLHAPTAHAVTLVGDFNDWAAGEMVLADDDHDGVWTLTVPLPPGRHAYQFVVDGGDGLADPNATAVPDGFGGINSILNI